MVTYKWEMTTSDADSQLLQTSGEIVTNSFDVALEQAKLASFYQITSGKAVYGYPGATCRGPYRIIRLALTLISQE